jgi:hypothetical protein
LDKGKKSIEKSARKRKRAKHLTDFPLANLLFRSAALKEKA